MAVHRSVLEQKVTATLIRVARLYRKEVNRALTSYGISDAQAVPVLHIARNGGGMRQNALAEEIGIQGPSLVRLLHQLCSQELVERREDCQDRRAKNLHLTPAGEALAARVESALTEIRGRLLASFSYADLTTCLRVIDALGQQLEDTRPGDDAEL